jgi:hypothetical protein
MLRNYNQIWSTFLVHCCNFFHGRGKLEIHELAEILLDQVKIYMMTDSPKPSQQRAWWWSSHPRTSFRAQGSLPSNRSGGRERRSTPAAGLRHQPAMSQVNRDALKFLQTALPMLGAVHWGLAERRKTKSWVPRGPCSLVSTQSCGKGLQTHRKKLLVSMAFLLSILVSSHICDWRSAVMTSDSEGEDEDDHKDCHYH